MSTAWNRGRKRPTIIQQKDLDRFWSKVKRGSLDDCWPWLASLRESGHGQMYWFGKPLAASRIAWWVTFGDPGDFGVLHKCDTPECCNPGHLFLGTQADNLNDMWGKGRGAHGDTHYCAKLTTAKAVEIREKFRLGSRLFTLAKEYGVHRMVIKSVVTNRTWKE